MLATREPKQDHPFAELEAEWKQRAVEVGLTAERLNQVMGRRREVTPVDPQSLFDNLASPDGLHRTGLHLSGGPRWSRRSPERSRKVAAAQEIESLAETFLDTGR